MKTEKLGMRKSHPPSPNFLLHTPGELCEQTEEEVNACPPPTPLSTQAAGCEEGGRWREDSRSMPRPGHGASRPLAGPPQGSQSGKSE